MVIGSVTANVICCYLIETCYYAKFSYMKCNFIDEFT